MAHIGKPRSLRLSAAFRFANGKTSCTMFIFAFPFKACNYLAQTSRQPSNWPTQTFSQDFSRILRFFLEKPRKLMLKHEIINWLKNVPEKCLKRLANCNMRWYSKDFLKKPLRKGSVKIFCFLISRRPCVTNGKQVLAESSRVKEIMLRGVSLVQLPSAVNLLAFQIIKWQNQFAVN